MSILSRVVVVCVPVFVPIWPRAYAVRPMAVNRRIWAYLRGWTC